jgi:hypothetical protein
MTALIDPPRDSPQHADECCRHGQPLHQDCFKCDESQPYVSYLLTLPCRTFAQAVRDVSKVRDLDDWVWEELRLRRHTAEVISLAHARAERRRT